MTSEYPIIIPDALSDADFLAVNEELKGGWDLSNSSKMSGSPFWGNTTANLLPLQNVWVNYSFKVRKHLQCPLRLYRVHLNGQTMGQLSQFHQDLADERTWTCLVFTQFNWNQEWGGEFVLFDPHKRQYRYAPYIPNTGVVFPANWDHKGNPPLCTEAPLRTSVAFTVYDTDYHK